MTVYYNEFDPFAAAWLRELIKAGHIADGVVDERSIEDVCPSDLRGFTQCHFFAGIGVWSYALRRAGWSDDRPVWTGSCPCQPFSAAGKGAAFADERHLWPAFYHLISKCRPAIVLGEQVASKDANAWLDLVHTDMEAVGFAFGAVAFPSAGVGAPHIRDRTYWLADAGGAGQLSAAHRGVHRSEEGAGPRNGQPQRHGDVERLGVTGGARLEGQRGGHRAETGQRKGSLRPVAPAGEPLRMADASDERQHRRRAGQTRNGRYAARVELERLCDAGRMADASSHRRTGQSKSATAQEGCTPRPDGGRQLPHRPERCTVSTEQQSTLLGDTGTNSHPTDGFWRDADWLFCRDGKWRPVEPGTFPLAHGAAARVGRLRGYGNAINAVAAQAFIESVMEAA